MNRIEQCFELEREELQSEEAEASRKMVDVPHWLYSDDMHTLQDNYDELKAELSAALQAQYNATNVKKYEQAKANVARIRRELAATADEIDEYGADGWHCSVCGHTMYGTDEPVDDGMCEDCYEESEYLNEVEAGEWE
jgi:rubrerythrin